MNMIFMFVPSHTHTHTQTPRVEISKILFCFLNYTQSDLRLVSFFQVTKVNDSDEFPRRVPLWYYFSPGKTVWYRKNDMGSDIIFRFFVDFYLIYFMNERCRLRWYVKFFKIKKEMIKKKKVFLIVSKTEDWKKYLAYFTKAFSTKSTIFDIHIFKKTFL